MTQKDKAIEFMIEFTKELQKYEVLINFFVRHTDEYDTLLVQVRRGTNQLTRLYTVEALNFMLSADIYIKDEVENMVRLMTGGSREVS